jgi:NitT/TauT family transport system ATP-binding protein
MDARRARVTLHRSDSLTPIPAGDDDPVRATSIRVAGVGHRYSAGRRPVVAIDHVDLEVAAGEFVAILGPSGCGKSTLLRLVAGLLEPSSGHVEIGGRRVEQPYTDLGFVFQDPTLLEWRTALRNILLQAEARGLARNAARADALELMRATKIDGFEDAYPHELSGGMRQRVAICRALLHRPPLLLMDEPFGALDALTREQMAVDLQRLWQDDPKTVMFVTHDIAEAVLLADRVVVMSDRPGRVLGVVEVGLDRPRAPDGTPEARRLEAEIRSLLRASGVIAT